MDVSGSGRHGNRLVRQGEHINMCSVWTELLSATLPAVTVVDLLVGTKVVDDVSFREMFGELSPVSVTPIGSD